MKVGTDGVLLGAWADVTGCDRVLDVGTGSGLIALMLAQRTESKSTMIEGVEIDRPASQQAAVNAINSPWADRVGIVNQSFEQFLNSAGGTRYDLIVCNPPFFDGGTEPTDSRRSTARNSMQLNREVLFDGCRQLLADTGRFAVVLPFEQYEETIELAGQFELHERRVMFVRPMPEQDFKRVLLEFSFEKCEVTVGDFAIETSRHEYTEAFAKLLGDFYLRYA